MSEFEICARRGQQVCWYRGGKWIYVWRVFLTGIGLDELGEHLERRFDFDLVFARRNQGVSDEMHFI